MWRSAASLGLALVLAACGLPDSPLRPYIDSIGPAEAIAAGSQPPHISDDAVSRTSRAVGPARIGRLNTAPSSPTGDELDFATETLRQMQLHSYATGAETCGYIGRDAQGRMVATPINVGREASCFLPRPPAGMRVSASIHTHGTYSPAYASEFPTVQDVTTDARDGINGYISTPGGRMWYVDTQTMTVRQMCGRGCLPQDPQYRPEDDGPVRPMFTLAQLRAWESY